jgi:hypothetical protein
MPIIFLEVCGVRKRKKASLPIGSNVSRWDQNSSMTFVSYGLNEKPRYFSRFPIPSFQSLMDMKNIIVTFFLTQYTSACL